MIIPCMNCTSASDGGGSVALVDGGSVRVGCPGAPGWTTTGVAGSACCAQTGSENRHTRVVAATRTRITDSRLRWSIKIKTSSTRMVKHWGFKLSQCAVKGTWVGRPIQIENLIRQNRARFIQIYPQITQIKKNLELCTYYLC